MLFQMEDKNKAKNTYHFRINLMRSSIAYSHLINKLSTDLHFVRNQTVVVKSQAKEKNKYFYVNMVAASGDVLRRNDLYLIGYEVDLKMYELKQTHHQMEPTIAGATLVELTMDYQGLTRHSNAHLGGCECMEKCITTLKAEFFRRRL
ncbi:polynucleotidyl transferase [Striga asiatica]|uniref:rRNA N-glycosylase n=1 Tax=Striga asiatica TaxID=4170 RepID=A0A5A7P703_STRAF|nr:polynucleotidyl transferase [Striga asiatica]